MYKNAAGSLNKPFARGVYRVLVGKVRRPQLAPLFVGRVVETFFRVDKLSISFYILNSIRCNVKVISKKFMKQISISQVYSTRMKHKNEKQT